MFGEFLSSLASFGDVLKDVVADSLRQRTALTNNDFITDLRLEARTAVYREVLVAMHVALILLDIVKIVTTDNDGALAGGRVNDTTHKTTTDRDVSSEGALLVDVLTVHGGLRSFEAETNVLCVAKLARLIGVLLGLLAGVFVDTSLLLVGTLILDGEIDVTSTVVLLIRFLNHFFLLLLFVRFRFFFLQ